MQNVRYNTNYLISVFCWWLIYSDVNIHGICNTLKYEVKVCKFLGFYSSINEVSIVMGYNTIQLNNWLPVFTNHIVVSSSRDEMFKKNEELKMLGTTYPMIWCHILEEQILQSSVFSACSKWSMELSALREILLTTSNIKKNNENPLFHYSIV